MKYRFLLLLVGVLAPLAASAAPITFNFTGTTTGVGGLAAGIWSGQGTDVVTGSISYDTDLNGLVLSSPGILTNKFQSNLANNAAFAGTWNITFTHGSVTRSVDVTDGAFVFILTDKTTGSDIYSFGAPNAGLNLQGPGALDGSLDGSAPQSAPDVGDFALAKGLYKLEGSANQLSFNLTSITPGSGTPSGGGPGGAVPEPSAALLFGVGAIVVRRAVRRKPATSS